MTTHWSKSMMIRWTGLAPLELKSPFEGSLTSTFLMINGSGFEVRGSGFRIQGAGFRIQDSGFRVQGPGFRVQGSGFRVQGPIKEGCYGVHFGI
jgi:hypothetical protein